MFKIIKKKDFTQQYNLLLNNFEVQFHTIFPALEKLSLAAFLANIHTIIFAKNKVVFEELETVLVTLIKDNPSNSVITLPKSIKKYFCIQYFPAYYSEIRHTLVLSTNELVGLYLEYAKNIEKLEIKKERFIDEFSELYDESNTEEEYVNLGCYGAGMDSDHDQETLSFEVIEGLLKIKIIELCNNKSMFKSIADEKFNTIIAYKKFDEFKKLNIHGVFNTSHKLKKFKKKVKNMCNPDYMRGERYPFDEIFSQMSSSERSILEEQLLLLYINTLFKDKSIMSLKSSLRVSRKQGLYEIIKSNENREALEKLAELMEVFYRDLFFLLQKYSDLENSSKFYSQIYMHYFFRDHPYRQDTNIIKNS